MVWLIIINRDRRKPLRRRRREAATWTAHDGTRFGLARTCVGDDFTWLNWPYRHRSSRPTRAFCSSSLAPFVSMMQSTHPRQRNDFRGG